MVLVGEEYIQYMLSINVVIYVMKRDASPVGRRHPQINHKKRTSSFSLLRDNTQRIYKRLDEVGPATTIVNSIVTILRYCHRAATIVT
jgi:hypothetical protein